jgi:hypothetical protein
MHTFAVRRDGGFGPRGRVVTTRYNVHGAVESPIPPPSTEVGALQRARGASGAFLRTLCRGLWWRVTMAERRALFSNESDRIRPWYHHAALQRERGRRRVSWRRKGASFGASRYASSPVECPSVPPEGSELASCWRSELDVLSGFEVVASEFLADGLQRSGRPSPRQQPRRLGSKEAIDSGARIRKLSVDHATWLSAAWRQRSYLLHPFRRNNSVACCWGRTC